MIRCPRCTRHHAGHDPLFVARGLRDTLNSDEISEVRAAARVAALRLEGYDDSCAFVVASEAEGIRPRRLMRVVPLPDNGFASAEVGLVRRLS